MTRTLITFSLISLAATTFCWAQENVYPVSGNVGIGTNDPQTKLDIQGGGVSISGTNPISSISGFKNVLQLKNFQGAAIVYNPGENTELMFGFHRDGNFYWGSKANGSGYYAMYLNKSGHLTARNSMQIGNKRIEGYALSVDGKAVAREITVTVNGWPDYVFLPEYPLMPLNDLAHYIQTNRHLPGIPNAREVEADRLNVGEMNVKLLEKIEELTLYILDQQKKIEAMDERIKQLEKDDGNSF